MLVIDRLNESCNNIFNIDQYDFFLIVLGFWIMILINWCIGKIDYAFVVQQYLKTFLRNQFDVRYGRLAIQFEDKLSLIEHVIRIRQRNQFSCLSR